MAARTRVLRTSKTSPVSPGALALGVALAGALAITGHQGPAAAAATNQETVFLPAGEGRTLDAGPSGWTSTTQVTAVGCVGGCPTATAEWQPSAGAAGAFDGALVGTVQRLTGQSGVATVTWRSPVFLTPPDALPATFSMATRASVTGDGPAAASSYRVRLLPVGGGSSRTVVDTTSSPDPGAGWTPGPSHPIPPGALPLGSLHRLEVELTFQFDSASRGGHTLLLDQPTLAVELPSLAALPPRSSTPATPDGGASPAPAAMPGPPRVDHENLGRDGDDLIACTGEEIIVVGASVTAGRIIVSGASSREPGSPVSLLSSDGWALGTTTVSTGGLFRTSVREPRASQRIVRVLARLYDGEQSPTTGVARDNVLHSARRVGNLVTVDGTLTPRARGTRTRIRLIVPGADPCGPRFRLQASSVRVDRRTGRYRATANIAQGAATLGDAEPLPVVAAQVTAWSPGLPHRVTTSQPILAAASGIAVR